jgi:hypothetical protein
MRWEWCCPAAHEQERHQRQALQSFFDRVNQDRLMVRLKS